MAMSIEGTTLMAEKDKTPPPSKKPPKRPDVKAVLKSLIASGGFNKEQSINGKEDGDGKR